MNRAFAIILVPAALVAAAYFAVTARLGVRLDYFRLLGAIVAFLVAVGLVRLYRRHRPSSGR
jgi:hypothetical protein